MLRIVSLLLLIVFTWQPSCIAQLLSAEVREAVTPMLSEKILDFPQVGIGGQDSDLWKKFEVLQQKASDEELFVLLRHENTVINGYAYIALAKRNSSGIYDFLVGSLKDNRMITIRNFDVINSYFMNDFYLYLTPKEILTAERETKVDSILIFDQDIRGSYKNTLLEQLPNDEKFYHVIRQSAHAGNGSALVTLARYRKAKDKDFIIETARQKKGAYHAFKAMREFPDTDFLDVLTRQFRKRWNRFHYNYSEFRMLYQALAQYPDQKRTLRIFRKTTRAWGKWKRNRFSALVKLAMLKYPHPNFKLIQDKIKLSDFEETRLQNFIDRDI